MIEGFQVKKVAIVADPRGPDKRAMIEEVLCTVTRHCEHFGIQHQNCVGQDIQHVEPEPDVDVFLVLGGDGTMIHCVSRLSDFNIPFFGLNYGNVGFMMNALKPDLRENIETLYDASFIMWKFPLLEIKATDLEGNTHRGYGLNDVYLQRMTVQTCKIKIAIDQQMLAFNPILCDGIIVSTPLGSTAYSYNATGSIVAIDCQVLTLTPLAANRTCPIKSLMLPMDNRIQVDVLEPLKRRVLVVSDGQNQGDIRHAEIQVSDKTVRLCFSSVFMDSLPVRFINKCK